MSKERELWPGSEKVLGSKGLRGLEVDGLLYAWWRGKEGMDLMVAKIKGGR